jgi:hypothetical protein
LAARQLGMEQIPTICLSGLSETQRRAYICKSRRFAESDKRRHGYSRDHRPDCVQVTPEGAPGILAFTTRCTAEMENPLGAFVSVTSAVVSMLSAVRCASLRTRENAIEKQPACAAPINSSGFVPGRPSNRLLTL